MSQSLYDLFQERSKIRSMSFPVALLMSLGFHAAIVALFLWTSVPSGKAPPAQPEMKATQSPAPHSGAGAKVAEPSPQAETPVRPARDQVVVEPQAKVHHPATTRATGVKRAARVRVKANKPKRRR